MAELAGGAAELAQKAANLASARKICVHMFFRVFNTCQNIQGEPQLVLNLCGGDVSAGMRLLAASSTCTGLIQFLINPTIGKLSDTFGRKKFFLVGPAFNVISNALIGLFPVGSPGRVCH
jgi:MFS family permease